MVLEPRSSVQVGHQFADASTIQEGKPGGQRTREEELVVKIEEGVSVFGELTLLKTQDIFVY